MSNFLSIVTNGNSKKSSSIFMKPVIEAKGDFDLPDVDKEIEKADAMKKRNDSKEEQSAPQQANAQDNAGGAEPAPTEPTPKAQPAANSATQNETFDMTAEADADGEEPASFDSAMDQDSFGEDNNQIESNFDENGQNNNLNEDNPAQVGDDNPGGMDFDSAMDPNMEGDPNDPNGQMPGADDGLNPQQNDNTISGEDSVNNFRLMHDFVDLYDLLVDTIERIDKINPTNMLVSQILSQASINLGDLKENVVNYMTFDVQKNPYPSNLQMYESCVCALKIVVEMLQQTKNAATK